MTRLRGQRYLITGASSGIGAALARELVARGAAVGLVARREERLRELAEELREKGGQTAWAAADVSDGEALPAALDRLAEELGGIDGVVANAGIFRPESPSRHKTGRAIHLYDVNLNGMLRLLDWAVPRFVAAKGGHIVGIASFASFLGMPDVAAYCGSKAAMRVHLQSLRVSLKRHGVAVTTISPGFIESEMTEGAPMAMPFLQPVERAARRFADAIERRKAEMVFPWQFKLLSLAVTRLPRALVERVIAPRRRR